MEKIYTCIDLKSFYASVECVERHLDPLKTNLVVADPSRTEKTICLAVTPSLKKFGIPGRARLFEVLQKVKEINYERRKANNYHKFIKSSYLEDDLKYQNVELSFIQAPPQMKKYVEYSTKIYNIYLKYFSETDIYVYSIDEVFIDLTSYLNVYKLSSKDLVSKVIKDIYNNTGITATSGIANNLYLCKIAMDIVAKHQKPNEIGVRIATLNEEDYKKYLWAHKPITDFWRVGKGIAKRLEQINIYTMGDIARQSIKDEEVLYKLLGINAGLLIDHAWGYEPVTLNDIKAYKPTAKSVSTGQVLHCAYNYTKTKLIIKEMTDLLVLDLVDKRVLTDQIVINIGYDIDNLTNPTIKYNGPITKDIHGRLIPKSAHGTINLEYPTSSTTIILEAVLKLYDKIINDKLLVRRINIIANNLIDEDTKIIPRLEQIDIFSINNNKDYDKLKEQEEQERKVQHTIIDLKKKYGKNIILKGMNLEEGATTIERNKQIGGHKE